MTDKAPDFVARRLNSIIKQVFDIEKSGKIASFNRAEVVWNAYSELHGNILEHMEVDNFFPNFKPHNAQHSEELLEVVKTRVREIADHFSLTLSIDKVNSIPSTQITQTQIVSQVNVQTLSNLIDNVNSLSIPQSDKEQIITLVKDFEDESKGEKEPKKLRNILFKVAGLSIDAAGFLLKHANEIGMLQKMLS